MLRMILYSIWNYEKAEARLASYEREGYRTEKAYFGRIFQLKKAEPREVQYVFLPVWPNTFAIMPDWELYLKQAYSANRIKRSVFSLASVYRIVRTDFDPCAFRRDRRVYLRRVFLQKILLDLFFLGLELTAYFWSGYMTAAGSCIAAAAALSLVHDSYGLYRVFRKTTS